MKPNPSRSAWAREPMVGKVTIVRGVGAMGVVRGDAGRARGVGGHEGMCGGLGAPNKSRKQMLSPWE